MRQDDPVRALLPDVVALAEEAGEAILAVYRSGDWDATAKGDGSPVTAADLAAHRCIVQRLATLTPTIPVVSEEAEGGAVTARSGRWWLVDPLDGTREFLARNGEFTVNIALVEEGRALFGVVHAPALGLTYWGGPELGALRREGAAAAVAIHVAPEGRKPLRVVASKSHLDADTAGLIGRLGEVELVQAGSSLKFCRLAEGSADLYPRLAPTCEWDTAAAQAVLEGAGGAVRDLQGRPLRYGKADPLNAFFIASASTGPLPA
ncbi:MAG: 3'(2'),5'-bisphosphate nucleotidase CysQ [Ramlibacter sp.]